MTPRELFEAYKAGCAAAGMEIEDTWESLEDYDRAGWEAAADLAHLRVGSE